MKLFSWLNELKTPSLENESEAAEPPLSPILSGRLRELDEVKTRDVMTPRALVTALDADVQLRRVRRLKSSKVAYFPVYKGDLDHILGWVAKFKVLELLNDHSEENSLALHARPVTAVNEDTAVSELGDLFIKSASPFLVVKNGQGTTTGIMPLSDFVELLFGFELIPTNVTTSPEPAPLLRGYEI